MREAGAASLGFAVATLGLVAIGPVAAAYGVAHLLTGQFGTALPAAMAGGLDGLANSAATVAFAITFGLTAGMTLPTILNLDWLAFRPRWVRPLTPRWNIALANLPDRVADRLGWFGPLVGTAVVLALTIDRWPAIDTGAVGRLVAGGSQPVDWLTILIPAVARSGAGALAAVIGGTIWSIALGEDVPD